MRSRVTVSCVFVNRQAGPWYLESLWAVCLCEQASWAMRSWVTVNCVFVNRQDGPWDLELLWTVCLCEQASWAMRSWVTVNCVFVNRQAGPWDHESLWGVCLCEQASWTMRSRVTVNCVFVWTGKLGHDILSHCELCVCVNRQAGPWDLELLWAVCLCEQASWAMRSWVTVSCVFVWTGKLGHETMRHCEVCVCVNRQDGPWVTVSCVFEWTGKLGHETMSHCELCVCVNRQDGPWVTVSCVFEWTGKLGHETMSHCELCVCVNRQDGPWVTVSCVFVWTGKLGHETMSHCELCDCEQASWAMRSWVTVSCVFVWTGKLGHEILSHCELCVCVNRQAGPWYLESLWAVCLCEQASWAMWSWVTVSCVFVWTGKLGHDILSHCELCVCVNRQAGPCDLESLWAVCLCEQASWAMISWVTVRCVFVWTGMLGHETMRHCEVCVCVNRQDGPWDLESLWTVCLWTGKLDHDILSHCEVCVCVNRHAGPWDHETLWGVCLCEQASWAMRSWVTVSCVFVWTSKMGHETMSHCEVCVCVNRQAGPWYLESLWGVCLCEQASWTMRSWVTVSCVFVWTGKLGHEILSHCELCVCEQASWAMRSWVTVRRCTTTRPTSQVSCPWRRVTVWPSSARPGVTEAGGGVRLITRCVTSVGLTMTTTHSTLSHGAINWQQVLPLSCL